MENTASQPEIDPVDQIQNLYEQARESLDIKDTQQYYTALKQMHEVADQAGISKDELVNIVFPKTGKGGKNE